MTPPSRPRPHDSRSAFGLLAVAVVLFGSAWPVMKIGLSGATPLWFAAARIGLGAATAFLLLAALGRLKIPERRDLPIVATIAIFQLTLFHSFSQLGLRNLPAGRSAVLAYTTLLFLVPLACLTGERINRWSGAGCLLGVTGIAVLLAPQSIDWTTDGAIAGHLWLLMAAASWALAIFHARRHAWHLGPLELLPWQLLLATFLAFPLAALFEPDGGIVAESGPLLCLAYLGILAGPTATWAATSVSRLLPTTVSSLGFLGVPVLGLTISALWLGEAIDGPLLLGAVLILCGVGAVTLGAARPSAEP